MTIAVSVIYPLSNRLFVNIMVTLRNTNALGLPLGERFLVVTTDNLLNCTSDNDVLMLC